MGCKLFVALQLEVPHNFIKGIARGRARRVEHPGAFGAAPTPKTVCFDPNEISGPDVLYHFLVRFLVRFSLNMPASFSALKWPSAGIGAACCFDSPQSKSSAQRVWVPPCTFGGKPAQMAGLETFSNTTKPSVPPTGGLTGGLFLFHNPTKRQVAVTGKFAKVRYSLRRFAAFFFSQKAGVPIH
jgi:hypothetical protein